MNTEIMEQSQSSTTTVALGMRKPRPRRPAGNPKSLRGTRGIIVQQEEDDFQYALLYNKKNNFCFFEFSRGPKSLSIGVLKKLVEHNDWDAVGSWLEQIRKDVFEGNFGQNLKEIKIFKNVEEEYVRYSQKVRKI